MNRVRVLVVEDEANACCALADLLREVGYQVATARDGTEGLARLETFHPDILLSDVRMPGRSGLELMRAAENRPDPPRVVLMSAYRRPDDVTVPWLEKPLHVEELLAVLEAACPRTRQGTA